jgi:hypothetical protein
MQFPTSGPERASKFLMNHNIKIRTNSAQSGALEKKGLGENEGTLYIVGAVHSLVRRMRPLLEIFAAPIGRRIL